MDVDLTYEEDKITIQGMIAFNENKGTEHNPYPKHSAEHKKWHDGWMYSYELKGFYQ